MTDLPFWPALPYWPAMIFWSAIVVGLVASGLGLLRRRPSLLIGGAIGWLGSVLTATLEEPVIEITLTALVAYGAFIIAEDLHFSGVIACVVAGMISGNWGGRGWA